MKRTRGPSRAAARLLACLGVAAVALAGPLDAQQARDECRCVDADGNEIENCTCFRAPRVDGLLSSMGLGSDRPRLGVSVDVTQSARRDASGALVTGVLEGGPADEAGIREGDVITGIDGRSLFESMGAASELAFDLDRSVPVQRLLAIVEELEPGQEVEVTFLRGDDEHMVTLEAEDLSDRWGRDFGVAIPRWDQDRFRDQLRSLTDGLDQRRYRSDGWAPGPDRDIVFRRDGPRADVRVFGQGGGLEGFVFGGGSLYRDGLSLVELNPTLGSYFGAEEGVLVTDVARSSGLGLVPGDVVLRIGDRAVVTPERFRRVLSSYGLDEEISFHILRDGSEETVTGQLRY